MTAIRFIRLGITKPKLKGGFKRNEEAETP
jgi:hypothetical protein